MTDSSKDKAATPGKDRPWIRLWDLNWPLVFLVYTVFGLATAGAVYTSDLAQGRYRSYLYPFVWQMTGHYTAFALLPVIILAFSRFPVTRHNWAWALPLHVLISMAVGVTHTYMMLLSRLAIYELLNLGTYYYGRMGYTLLMEYHKQFLHYWAVYAVLRALLYYRQSRERERAAAALELKASELSRQLTQAQLQTLRSQLNPHFLFNTLNMVSSVMYEDVNRADHMIAALSRMLRLSRRHRCRGDTVAS
jgi:hypothetical protein